MVKALGIARGDFHANFNFGEFFRFFYLYFVQSTSDLHYLKSVCVLKPKTVPIVCSVGTNFAILYEAINTLSLQ